MTRQVAGHPSSFCCKLFISPIMPFLPFILILWLVVSFDLDLNAQWSQWHNLYKTAIVDWCCFDYFVRHGLVALLEAPCARKQVSNDKLFVKSNLIKYNSHITNSIAKQLGPVPTWMIRWNFCDKAAATASWASGILMGFLSGQSSGDRETKYWLIIAFIVWNSNLVPLIEGLCT